MARTTTRAHVHAQKKTETPLSSMIDIVFLLLIFFIVTQKPIVDEVLYEVNMPTRPKDKTVVEKPPPPLFRIGVYQIADPETPLTEKLYTINNKGPYRLDYMQDYLKSVAKTDSERPVMITCGPNAVHKKLIQLLDACDEANLKNLNIINDESVRFRPMQYSTNRERD